MRKLIVLSLAIVMSWATMSTADAAKAKPKYVVSIAVNKTETVLGSTIKVSGKVSSNAKGKKVAIQRSLNGGAWKTVTTRTLTRTSTYSATFATTAAGPQRYRVLKPRSTTRNAGLSVTKALDVFRWRNLATIPTTDEKDVTLPTSTSINGAPFGLSVEVDDEGYALWDLTGLKCNTYRAHVGVPDRITLNSEGNLTVRLEDSLGSEEPNPDFASVQGLMSNTDSTYTYRRMTNVSNHFLRVSTEITIGQGPLVLAEPAVFCNS